MSITFPLLKSVSPMIGSLQSQVPFSSYRRTPSADIVSFGSSTSRQIDELLEKLTIDNIRRTEKDPLAVGNQPVPIVLKSGETVIVIVYPEGRFKLFLTDNPWQLVGLYDKNKSELTDVVAHHYVRTTKVTDSGGVRHTNHETQSVPLIDLPETFAAFMAEVYKAAAE